MRRKKTTFASIINIHWFWYCRILPALSLKFQFVFFLCGLFSINKRKANIIILFFLSKNPFRQAWHGMKVFFRSLNSTSYFFIMFLSSAVLFTLFGIRISDAIIPLSKKNAIKYWYTHNKFLISFKLHNKKISARYYMLMLNAWLRFGDWATKNILRNNKIQ